VVFEWLSGLTYNIFSRKGIAVKPRGPLPGGTIFCSSSDQLRQSPDAEYAVLCKHNVLRHAAELSKRQPPPSFPASTMSDQLKEILDVPQQFIRDGIFFLNRCTKPTRQGNPPTPIRFPSIKLTCRKNFCQSRGPLELDFW
jgi:hypothetical protein